jgi:ATP/maltotriose-dependent transcriptional regulator MalT
VSRGELLARAAAAAAASGDLTRAAGLAREAIELAADRGDREWQAALEDRRFWYLWESGDLDGAAVAIERANAALTATLTPGSQVRILTDLAQARLLQARYAEALSLVVEVHRQAGITGDPHDLGLALMIWGNALCALGRLDEGIARGREAIEVLDAAGDESVAFAVQVLAVGLYWAGRHRESVDMLLARYDQLRRDGLERRYGVALLSSLWDSLTDLGRWDEADRLAAEAAFPDGENRMTAWFHECVAELEVQRGDLARARSEIELAEVVVGPGASALDRIFMLRSVAGIARAEGRHEDVRQAIDEAIGQSSDPDSDAPLWWLFAFAARSAADRADDARARGPRSAAEVSDAVAYAERMSQRLNRISAIAADEAAPAPTLTAYTLHAAAELSRAAGRAEPAKWSATADAFAGLEQPIDEAYARFRQAEAMLAVHGDRREIAQILRAVHATSTAIGAQPLATDANGLARRARISLDAPGQRASADDREADRWNLTEREREVLGLLALGLSNREIGQRLFVTEKTASVHVSNILGKLAVPGRGAAAAVAVRLGLVPAEDPT